MVNIGIILTCISNSLCQKTPMARKVIYSHKIVVLYSSRTIDLKTHTHIYIHTVFV